MTGGAGQGHSAQRPVTVAIADDDARVRDALAALIAADPFFRLVGTASDAEEAIEVAQRLRADIVVADVQMPKGTGLRVVRELSVLSPTTRVIALSGYGDRKYVIQMLDAGAVGYMVKTARLDLLGALRAVSRGERVLSQEAAGHVIDELSQARCRPLGLDSGRIAQAIDTRDFSVAFQPIYSLHDGVTVGVEALARLSPDVDLPTELWFSEAWAVGLGPDLELAVLGEAVARARQRPPGTFLSVNVSPELAADGRFAALVTGPQRPHDLVIELTEHYAVTDYTGLHEQLGPLRRGGVRVAVDDLGAGYASCRHLIEMRPDMIKLDVSLTAEIDGDPARRATAAGLATVARELGAIVVAEGIETVEQLRCLTDLGVHHGQGYYLARPGPLEDAATRAW